MTDEGARRRILVATGDVVKARMAGPAIRAWQIASALAADHTVHLVSSLDCDLDSPTFATSTVDEAGFDELLDWCDVVIFQGHMMRAFPRLRTSDKVVVADIYDPFHLELLEQARELAPIDRQHLTVEVTSVLNEQLLRADFMLCASSKQRDFWLGQLAAMGRVNPANYDLDESLESLITVVPFGVADEAPVRTRPAIRGVVPGIGADDLVLLWGGGVYNWFDPLTLLRAIHELRDEVPNLRLFFLGLKHPNPHVGEMRMAVETRALADELGLTDRFVFFNEDWVAFDDRANYFLDADVGISTHLDHVETAFSFRTRILDYLWAGLPVVATQGDALGELIDEHSAGITVPPSDVGALADALRRIAVDTDLRKASAVASLTLGEQMHWSDALEPLIAFCRSPRRAPDLVSEDYAPVPPGAAVLHWKVRLLRDAEILADGVRRGQFRELGTRARSRIQRFAQSR
jgi:glycosyltransferase involved in cell wall biosynthesis